MARHSSPGDVSEAAWGLVALALPRIPATPGRGGCPRPRAARNTSSPGGVRVPEAVRRLAREEARWTATLAGGHGVACAILRCKRFVEFRVSSA
jgi:hypothetical protein